MLALIAGEGQLPSVLMASLDRASTLFRLCEFNGHPIDDRSGRPIIKFSLETLGSFLKELTDLGTTEVCFAGRVVRPKIDPAQIDPATQPLVPRMIAALQEGDDATLRTFLGFFEEAGLKIVAAHEIAPDLMPSPGMLSRALPSQQDRDDLDRGIHILGALGQVDLGQSCIVSRGQVLAVEAIGGTDWMMRSLMRAPEGLGAPLMEDGASWTDPIGQAVDFLSGTGQATRSAQFVRDPDLPEGGLLIKAAKPTQDMRVDVPTIGPQTLRRAAEVGLRGVVVE
ncbi:MAG: UDP-2,3-diacylglucosamine diphosphatase LpxI, partial [Pseudomonadota bacterium]